MKRKLLSIVLCGFMILGITGCGSAEENSNSNNDTNVNIEQKEDEAVAIIEKYGEYLNHDDADNAMELIDLDAINKILEIDLSVEDAKQALSNYEDCNYTITNIKFIESEKIGDALEEYAESYEEMTGDELDESYKDKIISMLDGYDYYEADFSISFYDYGETISEKDIFFIKKADDKYSFVTSIMTLNLFTYQYYMISNRPTYNNE